MGLLILQLFLSARGSGLFADSNLLLNAVIVIIALIVCGNELERVCMDASAGIFGGVGPACAWHTVEVLEPSVIMEVKDGRYGEDGSESFFNNR